MPGAIGLALFEVGASIGVVNAAIAVTSSLIQIGVSVGLSFLGNVLLKGKSPVTTPSQAQETIKQALADRQRSYGRVQVSGVVWWMDTDANTPSTLYYGIAINHGEISSYINYHIDENQVAIDGSGNVTTPPYSTYSVKLLSRLGLPLETKYTDLLTVFGVDNVRGDGVATILAEIPNPSAVSDYTKTFPNGRPLLRATIEATKVWDPRDPNQSFGDSTTWTWSENAALCLLHYLLSIDGYGMSYAQFAGSIASDWITAANVCDEQVPLAAGGTGARYRVAGTYSLTDAPKDVVQKFLSICDGRVWQKRDGSIGVTVGKFIAPTITFTADDIVGYTGMMFGQDTISSILGVRAQFLEPADDYRELEAEPWPSGEEVLALTTDRTATLDLLWAPSLSQARRLMKRAYMRALADWKGTIQTKLSGLQAIDERFVNLVIPELGINRSFEINRFTFDRTQLTCEMDVASIDASIDEWSASEEGSQESGIFGISSPMFAKAGTTINLLTEAGGKVGQLALVFCVNGTGISSTPGGWQNETSVSSGGISMALFSRTIDGTEGAVTVMPATGAILVVLVDGVVSKNLTNANSAVGNTEFTVPTLVTPYMGISFAGAMQDIAPQWAGFYSDPFLTAPIAPSFTGTERTGLATISVAIKLYGSGEIPDNLVIAGADQNKPNGAIGACELQPQ